MRRAVFAQLAVPAGYPRGRFQVVSRVRVAPRWLALVATGIVAAGAMVSVMAAPTTKGPGRTVAAGSGLPVAAWGPVSAALGRDDPAYRATPAGAGFVARNPRQRIRTGFSPAAVSVRSGALLLGIHLSGYGYGDTLTALRPVAPTASGNRVLYRQGALSEWWANGPLGLEQGFTLTARPAGRKAGPLTFALGLSGDARGVLARGRERVTFSHDASSIAYGGLVVTDARGRTLPARLVLLRRELLLRVDDAGARYPLRVDPFIQQAKLTGSDGAANDSLGFSLAVARDTIVAGAPYATVDGNAQEGAVYVFVKHWGGWANATQAAKLTIAAGAAGDNLGASGGLGNNGVGISGNTIVASAAAFSATLSGSPHPGAVYVFVEPRGGWRSETQSAKLTPADTEPGDNFGWSVAIAGPTIVAGSPFVTVNGHAGQGAAYVFVEPRGGWRNQTETQTAELTASDGAAGDNLGLSVAISDDTIVTGSPIATVNGNFGQGAAYVFVEPRGGWRDRTQTAKLTTLDGAEGATLGIDVAISGNTIIAGAPDEQQATPGPGAVYVFREPQHGWQSATQTAELTASDGASGDTLGASVAIDGETVAAGAPFATVNENPFQGAAYVFVEPRQGWVNETETAKLTASDGAAGDILGAMVGLSDDTIVAGAPFATVNGNASQGAAYVFGRGVPGLDPPSPTASAARTTHAPAAPRRFATCARYLTLQGERSRRLLSLQASLRRGAECVIEGLPRQIQPRAGSARPADARDPLLPPRPAPHGIFGNPFGSRSALVASAPVGSGPGFTAVDPATHTLYVTNGFNEDGNPDGGNTVSVIDERHCQADDVSRCKGPWPTLTVGSDPNADPSGVAIDQQTDTIYVADANDNTVSVFNGATCNAETSAGCGQTPAMVPVGMAPVAIFDDPANNTVYIPNVTEDDVSMLDTATCNATDLAACPTAPAPTVTVPSNPVTGAVDASTHTVYVTECGDPDFGCPAGTNGVSVFDASTCNATVQSGCDELGTIPTAFPPVGDAQVDPANQTLYMADGNNTISAFDLRSCNAADLAGCATDTPGTVTLPGASFAVALWVAVDPTNHSVYVTNQKDDSVIVVNANVCNGSDLAGCATLDPPEIHTGADPEVLTLDPDTQTLYTANQVDNDVSVIDATRCDAQTTSGCRARVPEAPIGSEPSVTADPPVATAYVANGANTVSMLDTNICNAFHTAGCAQAPPSVTVGTYPSAAAVDPNTHTVYVADAGAGASGTISVFSDRACNATNQAGCGTVSTLNVPDGNPVGLAVNPVTDTVYAATITSDGGPNLISVFNGSTCNAATMSGCDQTPANTATGPDGGAPFASTESVALNAATNTVYATSDVLDANPYIGDSVYVINGTTCDAADMAGCPNPPEQISVGSDPVFGDANPFGIAVDQATDTIYTANIFNGEGPGTVSVINGATCNAHNASGCDQTPATAPAGFGANAIAVDPTHDRVYATNIEDTSVTTIKGHTCNGTKTNGCQITRTRPIVGDYPGSISIDPAAHTAYVADAEGVSVMPLTP